VEVIRRLRKVSKEKELGEDIVEAIEIKSFDHELFSRVTSHPLVDFFGSSRRYSRFRSEESIQNIPVSFVPCRLPEKENLAEAWDAIVLTEDESIVLNSLKLIEPRVRGLAFIQGGRGEKSAYNRVRADERQAVIRVEGLLRPVPLKAMGDGMMRILQLVLSALKARNGFLLIDELENGLHYSVQERVWELLFEMAERNRSQVFVTTHSLDCVKAFARVAVKVAQKGILIKMNRDDEFETSVAEIKENELLDLISADIEIR
jgi:predicted ATPase